MSPAKVTLVSALLFSALASALVAGCATTREEPPAPPPPPVDTAALSGPARPPAPVVDLNANADAGNPYSDAQ